MQTLTQLIDRTAERLSMQTGRSVQIYAEDRIGEMIQHKFDVLFLERFWGQFTAWYQWTLDETTGVVTTDLTDIVKSFSDIQVIFPGATSRALTELSQQTVNPFQLSGTRPMFFEADSQTDKVFHIWPKTATGDLVVRARTKPDAIQPGETVNFDEQVLILGATYDYLEDDGTNPNATQKFQALFESRVKQLTDAHDQNPIALDPMSHVPDTSWHVA